VIKRCQNPRSRMYSSVHINIAHIAAHLQHNDRFSNCLLLCSLYKLYCSGRLEEVHRGNGCSYRICTEMVLQRHCLLYSTAIDFCSNFRHILLDTERAVTSNIVTKGEPTVGHSLCLCAPKPFLISSKKNQFKISHQQDIVSGVI
jgi:hypothetical protein